MSLSELDYTLLAAVWRDGPLTAYRLRRLFAESVTRTWSASPGSIYPAVKRLTNARLLLATDSNGGRGSRELTVTISGKKNVLEWIARIGPDVSGPSHDIVRSRLNFLVLVAPTDREAVIETARGATEEALRAVKARMNELGRSGDTADVAGLRGALYELRARLRWLDTL